MKVYKSIELNQKSNMKLVTGDNWQGESIEDKCRRVTEDNTPIEAISPMIYQERKDGVDPACNIRTDKWEIAQKAMSTIANGTRTKRQEKLEKQTDTATATGSEMNAEN